jgi:hypothetical protein
MVNLCQTEVNVKYAFSLYFSGGFGLLVYASPISVSAFRDKETGTLVDMACAAFWLNRKPQTLRGWASAEDGRLLPSRVNGRLSWSVSDIKRILGKFSK